MSAAAFKATYSDWRLIKGRKVVQIVFEVPLEESDKAYASLGGMPNPAAEVWCGVARLNPESEVKNEPSPAPTVPIPNPPARAKKSWRETGLAEQSGILCNDPKFWKFARERGHSFVVDEKTAAEWVRSYCGVQSRSQILPGTKAEQRLNLLVSGYRAWNMAPAVGAA